MMAMLTNLIGSLDDWVYQLVAAAAVAAWLDIGNTKPSPRTGEVTSKWWAAKALQGQPHIRRPRYLNACHSYCMIDKTIFKTGLIRGRFVRRNTPKGQSAVPGIATPSHEIDTIR